MEAYQTRALVRFISPLLSTKILKINWPYNLQHPLLRRNVIRQELRTEALPNELWLNLVQYHLDIYVDTRIHMDIALQNACPRGHITHVVRIDFHSLMSTSFTCRGVH